MRRKGKNISILLIVLLLIQIVFENSLFCFRVNADTDVSNTSNSLEETDTDDYGNSIEEASVVYQNSIVEDIEGKIDYCGDIDYIKFYPSGSNTLIIESYGEGSLSGYLYDEDGNLLVSDKFSGEGQNFKFEYEFKCAKAYYLAIKSYSITNYKLKIHEKYLGP